MTKIRISSAGREFIAETHPDAPLTVAAFLKLLPYKEKLIELPAFLSTGGLPADGEELRKGLDLTVYFL